MTNTLKSKKDCWTDEHIPSVLVLYDMAMKRTYKIRDKHWREDIIQDAMVRLLEYLQRDEQDVRPVTMFLRSIDYLIMDAFNPDRAGTEASHDINTVYTDAFEEQEVVDLLIGGTDELDDFISEQQYRTAKRNLQVQLVQNLPGVPGDVVRMLLWGFTGKQIAEKLGVTPQAISLQRKKAEQVLRGMYNERRIH